MTNLVLLFIIGVFTVGLSGDGFWLLLLLLLSAISLRARFGC